VSATSGSSGGFYMGVLATCREQKGCPLPSRTDILRSDAKVGNERGRRDCYDLPTGVALIDIDKWVQSDPGQLANFDSGAPAVFAGRRALCLHLGHTNQRHF
jgi:hypothetical protein